MSTQNNSVTVTIMSPTGAQMEAINKILGTNGDSTTTATVKTRKAPPTTVSDDEDEDFGTKKMTKKNLKNTTEEDDDESEDKESEITFEEVKEVLNEYGEDHPDEARAILMGFNIKSTKELKTMPSKWELVWRKVKAKMKKH